MDDQLTNEPNGGADHHLHSSNLVECPACDGTNDHCDLCEGTGGAYPDEAAEWRELDKIAMYL